MKAGPLLFRITGIVVFIQILLGGLLTFDFISPEPHIITGFLVFILAIATMIVSLVTKPSFRPVQGLSVVLVVLILIQILLGFATLSSASSVLAWVHFLVAMAIYGAAIAGTFMALRWNQMARSTQAKDIDGQKKET